jgi:hypothetical protein
VRTADTADDWLVRIGPDGAETSRNDNGEADCEVHAAAHDLYLALWNRHDRTGLRVDGDGDVLALFQDRVRVRWR